MFAPEIIVESCGGELVLQDLSRPEALDNRPEQMNQSPARFLGPDFRSQVSDLLDRGTEAESYAQLQADRGQLIWGIRSTAEDRMIGLTGLRHDRRTGEPLSPGWRQIESFGVVFESDYRAPQRMADVQRHQSAFAFSLGIDVVRMSISRDNYCLNQAAEGAGFICIGQFFERVEQVRGDWHNDYRLYEAALEYRQVLRHMLSVEGRKYRATNEELGQALARSRGPAAICADRLASQPIDTREYDIDSFIKSIVPA